MTENEMVVLADKYGHEFGRKFEQTPRDGEEQESLVCCSPRGCKELDVTERLKNNCREASESLS